MILCFTGQPLSGKTSVARRVADDYGWKLFSAGEYARQLGMDKYEPSIKEKGISLEMNDAINARVKELASEEENLVLDGYPRSVEQALLLQSLSHELVVFFFFVNPILFERRLKERGREGDGLSARDRSLAALEMYERLFETIELEPFRAEGPVEKAVEEIEWLLDGR